MTSNNEDIVLFGSEVCYACKKAKTYLRDHNINFMYIDIDNPLNRGMFNTLSIQSIPVLKKGDLVIVGFDEEQYEELFKE